MENINFNLLLDGMNYFNKYNRYLNISLFDDPIIKEEAQIFNDRIFIQVKILTTFSFQSF